MPVWNKDETVRDGLTRRAYDAIANLTLQVKNGDLPMAHAFCGLLALYETITPFCSTDGRETLDEVVRVWGEQIKADEELVTQHQRHAKTFTLPATDAVTEQVPWG